MGGKTKTQRLALSQPTARAAASKKKARSSGPPLKPPPSKPQAASHTQPSQAAPTIPFLPTSRTLLIGEGDLSFALSLLRTHCVATVLATVYEASRDELLAKYPHAAENVEAIVEAGGTVLHGVDAGKTGRWGKELVRERWDRVVFNFPHVGGKSTDVNRQVRYNQELLVEFFKKAMKVLAPAGQIIVTLFEGEPYTLWNIRDLGRHAGLQVERSFKFQAVAYPGYHHARTLGVVKGKNGEVGKGWKGEERASRSYIFVRKGEVKVPEKKRKRSEVSEDEESELEDED